MPSPARNMKSRRETNRPRMRGWLGLSGIGLIHIHKFIRVQHHGAEMRESQLPGRFGGGRGCMVPALVLQKTQIAAQFRLTGIAAERDAISGPYLRRGIAPRLAGDTFGEESRLQEN